MASRRPSGQTRVGRSSRAICFVPPWERFRAGDVFEKELDGQGITAVTISDTGTCIFLVEVYEDDRHGTKP